MSDKEAESSDTDVDEFPLSTLKMDSSPEKTSKMDTSPQKTPETSVAFKFSHPLSATHRVNQSWSTEDQKSDNTAVSISTSENQVWSLTQLYSVDFSQSRIAMSKSASSTNAQSRFGSVVVDSVLGPPRLKRPT